MKVNSIAENKKQNIIYVETATGPYDKIRKLRNVGAAFVLRNRQGSKCGSMWGQAPSDDTFRALIVDQLSQVLQSPLEIRCRGLKNSVDIAAANKTGYTSKGDEPFHMYESLRRLSVLEEQNILRIVKPKTFELQERQDRNLAKALSFKALQKCFETTDREINRIPGYIIQGVDGELEVR